ncbi:MAG: GTPase/DUF3482 domain-containing protein [Thermodesulfobacteriota bacterium]
MKADIVPEFAVLGHPNEGKSSVVSTLSEDDSVIISPVPGETSQCRVFPVTVDGRELIRFTDTPGFQRPGDTLEWIRAYTGPPEAMVRTFIESHRHDPEFQSECELLTPLAGGAGVIFVVDGSRPVRRNDLAEMEILRLIGSPRMGIINCKTDVEEYLPAWKAEFGKCFNAIRVFNAHHALFGERIRLLESLKAIDQDSQEVLENVIAAFRRDWGQRIRTTAAIICDLIEQSLRHETVGKFPVTPPDDSAKEALERRYREEIGVLEKTAHDKIRRLFKHNIFNKDLPACSIINEPLFSRRTWQVLGLKPGQLAAAAAVGGGLLGVKLDLATAGISFGVFTAIGSALGAGAALLFGEQAARARLVGLRLGGYLIRVGPNRGMQLPFILLDRALIYYSHISNWAHGRREDPGAVSPDRRIQENPGKATAAWSPERRKICGHFIRAVHSGGNGGERLAIAREEMMKMLQDILAELSGREKREPLQR